MKKYTSLLLFLMVTGIVSAQTLKGIIVDEKDKPMSGVSVCLLAAKDSSFVSGIATDENGVFSLSLNDNENILRISRIGYLTKYINGLQPIDLGNIQMQPDAKQLKDVNVTGNNIITTGDKMIIRLSDAVKKNAFNGYAALSAMTIPGLSVDPIDYTVKSKRGDVLLCINGREVGADEIRTLYPKDIDRIDYYQNFDPKHPQALAVVDFIMKIRDDGGLLYADAKQHLNIAKGNGVVDIKHYHNKIELNAQLSANYDHHTPDRGDESVTEMTFDDATITKTSETNHSPIHANGINGKISCLKQGKNDMFHVAAYVKTNHNINDNHMSQAYSSLNEEIFTRDYTHSDNFSPAMQLYYQRKPSNGNSLYWVKMYGNYSHTDKERFYTSSSNYQSKTAEDFLRLYPTAFFAVKAGAFSPYICAMYDYKQTENKYRENGNSRGNKLSYGDGTIMLGNNFRFSKKLAITVQLAANILSVDNRKEQWNCAYFIPSVNYNADLGHGNVLSGTFNFWGNDPQMSYYNGSSQRMDQYQILYGNPNLRASRSFITNQNFNSNRQWGLIAFHAQYLNMPKYIYEDVYADNENNLFVHTYKNGSAYKHFLFDADVRFNLIPKKLVWMIGGEYAYMKEELNEISEVIGGTELTYMHKNFLGKIEFTGPMKYLARGVQYENPTSLKVMMKYTVKNLQIGLNATNPFMQNYKKTVYSVSNYSNITKAYNPRLTSDMFMFTLSYRMSYGKKHKFQKIDMDDSQSSGLLNQQDIRDEKMETGKK